MRVFTFHDSDVKQRGRCYVEAVRKLVLSLYSVSK